MTFAQIYLIGLGVVLVMMVLLWVASLILKNASIVDIFWGPGFILAGWLYFALTDGAMPRKLLIMALVTIWGLRLGGYILYRNFGKPEDFRYAKWRAEHGSAWWWQSFFQVFLLQGVLLWIISAPLLKAQADPTPASLTALDFAGLGVWAIGFFFEAVGDFQLARFKANPANKGKVLDSGVWRYTRHPNYFGDAAQWWGFFLIALGTPLGILTVFSPILMTVLLVRVSGVALLEKTLKEEKPHYRDYIERTSAFIPWFPKRGLGKGK